METTEKITPSDVADINKALRNHFCNGYHYRIFNSYIFRDNWESDFFCTNRDGYSFEMEVKVSRSDFKADFKKEKHKLFQSPPLDKVMPNRFYFAVPEGLLTIDEVPVYAGLIYVKNSHAMIVKRAPFIHRRKYDFRKRLCDKFYYQMVNYRIDNDRLVREIKGQTDYINKLRNHFGKLPYFLNEEV
jgi:hypothetical protein